MKITTQINPAFSFEIYLETISRAYYEVNFNKFCLLLNSFEFSLHSFEYEQEGERRIKNMKRREDERILVFGLKRLEARFFPLLECVK